MLVTGLEEYINTIVTRYSTRYAVHERDCTSELAAVSSTCLTYVRTMVHYYILYDIRAPGDLSVFNLGGSCRLEGDTDFVGSDGTVGEKVVSNGGDKCVGVGAQRA